MFASCSLTGIGMYVGTRITSIIGYLSVSQHSVRKHLLWLQWSVPSETLSLVMRGSGTGHAFTIPHNSLVSAMVCDVIPARIRISAAPFSDFMALELACQPFRYPDGVFLVLWKNTNRASGPD